MKRFTKLPTFLYRIQANPQTRLRDYDTQMAKGRRSFDLRLHDGLVMPLTNHTTFEGPNGMSLRPATGKMRSILEGFRGEPTVYRFNAGMELPDGLAVYHEHSDHWSLQTTEPIGLPELNDKLTKLLASLPSQTREQFIEEQDDVDDQDN